MDSLHSGLLLQLPDQTLEQAFWSHERTLRAYTAWDTYLCFNVLVGQLITLRVMLPVLTSSSSLPYIWHIHLELLTNLIGSLWLLALIHWHPDTYRRNRHRIALFNRLLRLLLMAAAAAQSSHELHALLVPTLSQQPYQGHPPDLATAAVDVARQLVLPALMTLSHGNFVFQFRYWLPLQLLACALQINGVQRHQPCSIAANPSSALVLQSTCSAITQLYELVVGSFLGTFFLTRSNTPSAASGCRNPVTAAHTLMIFCQLVHGLLVAAAGFMYMEWSLKSAWVKEELGKQLMYGPAWTPWSHCMPMCPQQLERGSPRRVSRRTAASTAKGRVHNMLALAAVLVAGLGLLWSLSVDTQPILPLVPCPAVREPLNQTCVGHSCAAPGWFAGAVVGGEMCFIYAIHVLTCAMM